MSNSTATAQNTSIQWPSSLGVEICLLSLVINVLASIGIALLLALSPLAQTGTPLFSAATILIVYLAGSAAQLGFLSRRLKNTTLTKTLHLSWNSITRMKLKYVILAIFTTAACIGIDMLISKFLPPKQDLVQQAVVLAKSGFAYLLFAFTASIVAPIVEEIFYRGCLYNASRAFFQNSLPDRAADYSAIVASATVFSAMHMTPSAFPHLLVFGIAQALLYRHTRSLVYPIISHAVSNGFVAAMIFFAR